MLLEEQLIANRHIAKQLGFAFSAVLLLAFTQASRASLSIEGLWLTANGEGWIEIRMQDGAPAGFIAGSPDDPDRLQPQELDEKNPDPALRNRPLYGLQIIFDLNQTSDRRWKGHIYDPSSGKIYKCILTLADDNTLKLRGYIGFSLFGRTQVWTREQ